MAYLDLPRLHFGGIFYTDPGTRNNITENFAPDVGKPGGPPLEVSWNDDGKSDFFFRHCRVFGAVDGEGTTLVNPATFDDAPGSARAERAGAERTIPGARSSTDPLLAARVRTPNPFTDLIRSCPGMNPSMAKISDLDPDQQGRSALFGLQLAVLFEEAEQPRGFWGRLTVPILRDVGYRIEPQIPEFFSRNLGGVWHGLVRSPHWLAESQTSELLGALRQATRPGARGPEGQIASGGLAVKLTMDLYQPQARYQDVVGNDFGYGRIAGTVGPHYLGEPEHALPGRRMVDGSHARGPAPFLVREVGGRSLLSLDLGNSLFLSCQPSGIDAEGRQLYRAEGELETPAGYRAMVADPEHGVYEPLSDSCISFLGRSVLRENLWKNNVCQVDSLVANLWLDRRRAALVKNGPVGLFLDGAPILLEASDGWQFDVLSPVVRLEQGYDGAPSSSPSESPLPASPENDAGSGAGAETHDPQQKPSAGSGVDATPFAEGLPADWSQAAGPAPWDGLLGPRVVQLRVQRFGRPVSLQKIAIPFWAVSVRWYRDADGQWQQTQGPPDIEMRSNWTTDAAGLLSIELRPKSAPMELSSLRQALGSRMNFLQSAWPVGDNSGKPVSVLVWSRSDHPADPSWADVQPILEGYARTYPGMVQVLDIADPELLSEPLVNATLIERFGLDPAHPSFMPVTRDLAPSRIGMMVRWLRKVAKTGSATGDGGPRGPGAPAPAGSVASESAPSAASPSTPSARSPSTLSSATETPMTSPQAADAPAAEPAPAAAGETFARAKGNEVRRDDFARASDTSSALPFRIELEPVAIDGMPGLHSFSAGILGHTALLLGGWSRGMHGFATRGSRSLSPVFDPKAANERAWAVDLEAGKVLGSRPLAGLGQETADHLGSANTQFGTDGEWLYVFGGFGISAGGTLGTQPRVTAIRMSAMIEALRSKDGQLDADFARRHLAFERSLEARITGGNLGRLGEYWVLGFGQDYDGSHGLDLMHSDYQSCWNVFTLDLREGPPPALRVRRVDRQPDDPTMVVPSSPMHRRDLTLLPAIYPDGSRRLVAWGGAFKGGRFQFWVEPIVAQATPEAPRPITTWAEDSIQQLGNNYRCAAFSLFSARRRTSWNLFFGGISQYRWNSEKQIMEKPGGLVGQPFVSSASAIVLQPAENQGADSAPRVRQFLLDEPTLPPKGGEPVLSQPAEPIELPPGWQSGSSRPASSSLEVTGVVGPYLGTETRFLPAPEAPRFDNGVIDVDAISTPTLLGYFVGGIAASQPEVLGSLTWASDRVYRVRLVPGEPTSGRELGRLGSG